MDAPLPLDDLPPAPERPGATVPVDARRAVTVLTRELDALLAPLTGQLEAGVPAGS
ncbi:hypothetical protein [Micromonospora auratinigra]|uniref:Uncharacterized protein n=1 Tax=Micromonospora auratinigra TaxID=261654 RepID=A0A1A8Z0V7_9ACTN|nr:hypothetical protein [Micromonospora auratinigra]SBT37430.1 hypothetical protein GA0070611_0207 [Micromonospora auratinigra]